MLSQSQRTTILELHRQGVPRREIARLLEISRVTVRCVLQSNSADVPELNRPEKAEPYRQQILELMHACKGTWCGSMKSWRRGARSCRMRR
jgi:transposase